MVDNSQALKGAFAVGLSTFSGVTSFFTMAMAAGVARFLDGSAQTACYTVVVLCLLNGVFALARGRRSLALAIAFTASFLLLNVVTFILYVRTW